MKRLLWKHQNKGGFENALGEIQFLYRQKPKKHKQNLNAMQSAISAVFDRMNNAFLNQLGMEFQDQIQIEMALKTFMFNFDAIFKLNQDIFLEHHYCHHLQLCGVNNFLGSEMPGMKRISNQDPAHFHAPSWGRDSWIPKARQEFVFDRRHQPLFKLHGSSNWKDREDNDLLIMGNEKSQAIASNELLDWYFRKFTNYLAVPNTKLFVIGYGFRDEHVNKAIANAVEKHGLKFFVIDPLGADVITCSNPSHGGDIAVPFYLDATREDGLIGLSKRNLSEIFGGDLVAHAEVMNFFK